MVGRDSDAHHGFCLTRRDKLCGAIARGLLILSSSKLSTTIETQSAWGFFSGAAQNDMPACMTSVFLGQTVAETARKIASKSTAFRLAPPTSAPPTSESARMSCALEGLTDPP